MAEICLDCMNKINGTNYDARKYILSDELELCEECGEWKKVIIVERNSYYLRKLHFFALPFIIFYKIICFLGKLIMLPFLIYKYIKRHK